MFNADIDIYKSVVDFLTEFDINNADIMYDGIIDDDWGIACNAASG